MTEKQIKILVILGPTSTGKSDLAVRLARRFGGEVISADSRQVYKGLDIATGKITKKEMRGIAHHLLSMADPRRTYNVARYIKDASRVVRYIEQKGKLPIICGGTGFYISALLGEITLTEVPPNKKLRKELSKKNKQELFNILKKLGPKRAKIIDKDNPVRLIRAIEIAKARKLNTPSQAPSSLPYKVVRVGLRLPPEELKKCIHLRTLKRMKAGMIQEARRLHQNGLSFKRMNTLGLEYRLLAEYLQNKITKEELVKKIEMENRHYAKRQMTWFKRDKGILWFSPKDYKKIEKVIFPALEMI